LEISARWAKERVQWGKPIGEHAAIAGKIAEMAAATFAMESMTMLTASLVDRAKSDFRLESAICKMLGSEWAWKIANDTMQIGAVAARDGGFARFGESPGPWSAFCATAGSARFSEVRRNHAAVHRAGGARPASENRGAGLDQHHRCPWKLGGMRAAGFYASKSGTFLPSVIGRPFEGGWRTMSAGVLDRAAIGPKVVSSNARAGCGRKASIDARRFVDIGPSLRHVGHPRERAMVERAVEASNALDLAEYFCRCSRFASGGFDLWPETQTIPAIDFKQDPRQLPEILSEESCGTFRNANRSESAARPGQERFRTPGLSEAASQAGWPTTPPPSPGCHPCRHRRQQCSETPSGQRDFGPHA
jgi:hypothetical protein